MIHALCWRCTEVQKLSIFITRSRKEKEAGGWCPQAGSGVSRLRLPSSRRGSLQLITFYTLSISMIRPREGLTFHLRKVLPWFWSTGTRGVAVCVSIIHMPSRLHVLPTQCVYLEKRSTIEVPRARSVSGNDPLSESWSQLKCDPHSTKHLGGRFSRSYIHYIYLLSSNKYGWEWCSTPVILSLGARYRGRSISPTLISSSATE